jgi:hypothetical protein
MSNREYILGSIREFFDDESIPKEDVLDALQDIIQECDILIETLRDELSEG